MLEKLIEVLAALAVAVAGLGVANDSAADHDANGVGWTIAEEVAALDAAGFGLERAAEARGTADHGEGDEEADAAVDGQAHALEVLAEVAAGAPEQAQAGLTTAMTAVAAGGGDEAATTGAVVTEVPAQVPANVPAHVPAPPVTVVPPTDTPPVDVSAGPPAELPGGGNRP